MAMVAHAGLASPVAWWLVVAHGERSACLGLLLLARTGADDLLALLALLGVSWALGGLLEVAGLAHDRAGWVWSVLSGAVQAGAAAVVLRHPLWSTLLVPSTLVTTVGVLGVAIGRV